MLLVTICEVSLKTSDRSFQVTFILKIMFQRELLSIVQVQINH
jgi:hypothetical protein